MNNPANIEDYIDRAKEHLLRTSGLDGFSPETPHTAEEWQPYINDAIWNASPGDGDLETLLTLVLNTQEIADFETPIHFRDIRRALMSLVDQYLEDAIETWVKDTYIIEEEDNA